MKSFQQLRCIVKNLNNFKKIDWFTEFLSLTCKC